MWVVNEAWNVGYEQMSGHGTWQHSCAMGFILPGRALLTIIPRFANIY